MEDQSGKKQGAKPSNTAEQTELQTKTALKMQKRALYIAKMNSKNSFGKLILLIRTKFFDFALLLVVIYATFSILGVVARFIWEAWKVIFSV